MAIAIATEILVLLDTKLTPVAQKRNPITHHPQPATDCKPAS